MTINSNNLYSGQLVSVDTYDEGSLVGRITEQDKLLAAKQILIGLGVLFVITIVAYLISPEQGAILLEICKTVLPPLATLIIAFYFNEKR